MKRFSFLLLLILAVLMLSGCVFPLQHVSPDPDPSIPASGSSLTPTDAAVPAPRSEAEVDRREDDSQTGSAFGLTALRDPKLAVFWYAMADANVFALREQFGPALENSGLPWREFDAENDRYRQLDQVREAVSGGWNILAIQLVSDGSSEDARALVEAAGGCPVIFFDRVPDPESFSACIRQNGERLILIASDATQASRVQGGMIGEFLAGHYTYTDLNQDGRITYTMLIGDREDPAEIERSHTVIDEANRILVTNGYSPLVFFDLENSFGVQASPDGSRSSDAGTSVILADLETYNYANSNTIELIAACNDDMALGALTALQAAWCNLGDGNSVTIPLFGLGASAAARSAVELGQMTGTVELNASGFARVVLAAAGGFSDGRSASEICSELSASSDDCYAEADTPGILYLAAQPILR